MYHLGGSQPLIRCLSPETGRRVESHAVGRRYRVDARSHGIVCVTSTQLHRPLQEPEAETQKQDQKDKVKI